jgi:hypothetical protein
VTLWKVKGGWNEISKVEEAVTRSGRWMRLVKAGGG